LRGGCGGEVWSLLKAEHRSVEHGGHALDGGVVGESGVVKAATLDRDAVFAALELGLQGGEVAGCLKIGVTFGDDEQAGERGAEAALGALEFGTLLSGAVLTEQVFSIPGFGKLIVDAVFNRDYAVVQGVVLVTATVYILLNLLADVLYVLVNPRLRT
jgi:hypothetical protein